MAPTSNEQETPADWPKVALTRLASGGLFADGDWVETKDQDPNGRVRLVQIADIGDGEWLDRSDRSLTRARAEQLGTTFLHAGDVLVARMGVPLGRACQYPGSDDPAVTVVDATIIRTLPELVDPRWLMHALNSPTFRRAVSSRGKGSGRIRIPRTDLGGLELPLPPRALQGRIAQTVDRMLADNDVGRAECQQAVEKLRRYREEYLAAATVRGVVDAAEDPTREEDGADFLSEILRLRRERWEEGQSRLAEASARPLPTDWRDRYPTPAEPDLAGMPQLPSGWVWASLDMLGELVSGLARGRRSGDAPQTEVPYLRVANVQSGRLDLDELRTMPATTAEVERYALRQGDVVLTEGGDRDKLGRGWVWKDASRTVIHQNHVFRLRPATPSISSELVAHHANGFGRRWFADAAQQTTNLASISLSRLRTFPVPVAPRTVQSALVAAISGELNRIDGQLRGVERALSLADDQRARILDEAYHGSLVPSERGDSSASKVLEELDRMAAEASPNPGTVRGRRRKEHERGMKSLRQVLVEAKGWLPAQEAFRRCGAGTSSSTPRIEEIYAELRRIDALGELETRPIDDAAGRKTHDELRLRSV